MTRAVVYADSRLSFRTRNRPKINFPLPHMLSVTRQERPVRHNTLINIAEF